MTRLPEQPAERIDRNKLIRFTFDGKRVQAYEGDTIGSALYAAGQRTFSRSFKYHRRRGLMCCAGQCPNCIVAVDGAPGARACTEQVRDGMKVEHLNAWPSLEHDVMSATDAVGGTFTPPGFYYKTFIRPRRLWPVYEKVLRHAAGLGKLRHNQPEREWKTEYRRRHADVLVIGGGAAGLSAARVAAQRGADVVLVDEGPEPGGRLLAEGQQARVDQLLGEARDAGVEIIARGSALGFFDGLVPVWQGDTLHQLRARRHVIATGTIEQPLVFAGNDLPGVMLSDGARRLAALYAVKPGTRAVVATTSDRGLEAAIALHEAGVQVAAVADLRSTPGAPSTTLKRLGIEVLAAHTVVHARGKKQVSEAVLMPVQSSGAGARTFQCDLVVVSGGTIPASSLLLQAGAKTRYDDTHGNFAITETPEHVAGAGEVIGHEQLDVALHSGELAGLEAVHALGLGDSESSTAADELHRQLALAADHRAPVAVPPAAIGAEQGKCFACLCEDVTSKDIGLSINEGYDSIELAKRYTTVTMGPCQGRMCQLPAVRVMAQQTGQSLADVGTTTARPPWVSVPMGILGGRPIEPAKRSAIHDRHRALGATVKWAGDWRRAYDYGDPQGEALNVNTAAGIIDVSTLGKLVVRGPDAGEFLDRLYPNRFSNLKPGRIRYGVISSDAGRIVDDGTICRLDDETYYVTTTSSGAGAVEEWFGWWLADWKLDVRLTDLTQGMAAVNLAGPRAREIISA
ncbi:MAG TPA: FAD-dependent oxidoreductase, partial [Solirubrobacteraceae bacterium]